MLRNIKSRLSQLNTQGTEQVTNGETGVGGGGRKVGKRLQQL